MRHKEAIVPHADSLFLNTLHDLESRIADTDEYNVLGSSALIRKLLIDNSPLVDQVNRQYQLKLVFEISESSPSILGVPGPTVWSVQDGLDPETSRPGKPRKVVNRDQLLATVLAVVNGKSYTLREIVLFETNIMGGVHAGSPREEKERILNALNSAFAIGGHRASLRQLQAIGRVVLKGLGPLRAAVTSRHGA
jgi:hypothetical protein